MSDISDERKYLSHEVIFDYWRDKFITESGEVILDDHGRYDDAIPVVEYPTEPCCWACGRMVEGLEKYKTYNKIVADGDKTRNLYGFARTRKMLNRCHIVPHAMGGADQDPANLFLMCETCHEESPDTANPKNFLAWVYKRRKRMVLYDGNLHDIRQMMDDVIDLCKEQGKDPLSGDVNAMQLMNHCHRISDSSFVYAYVDTCKPIK